MEINPMDVDSEALARTVLFAEEINIIRSVLGAEAPEAEILRALSAAGNSTDRAINLLLDMPVSPAGSFPLKQEMEIDSQGPGETGVEIKKEEFEVQSEKGEILIPLVAVKKEKDEVLMGGTRIKEEKYEILMPQVVVKEEKDEVWVSEIRVKEQKHEILMPHVAVKKEKDDILLTGATVEEEKDEILMLEIRDKKEKPDVISVKDEGLITESNAKKEPNMAKKDAFAILKANSKVKKEPLIINGDNFMDLTSTQFSPYLNARPIRSVCPTSSSLREFHQHVALEKAERGDFPAQKDWFLVGKSYVTGLSTCRGNYKLVESEIVHFSFPKLDARQKFGRQWVSAKAAAASLEIIRFSTKRSGEIGRLPVEWARCLIPLVDSKKVKVQGRCVITHERLTLMQEIVLHVSFYIHSSIFTEGDKSSWKLAALSHLDSTVHPLPTLFKFLKIKPFKKADFTPQELDSRKRSLDLKDDDDESEQTVGLATKRRRGDKTYPEQSKDEQAISESSLNKLVGTAELYDLEEAETPSTLTCDLRPYQKQALYWMSELEKGIDVEQAAKTLHPCWEAYNISDGRSSAVYVNVFSGEATTQFPSATQMARGGILADAMGLGKTVMTIALILGRPSRENSDDEEKEMSNVNDPWETRKTSQTKTSPTVKGGTLIVCPMALLGQWKDELEAHSQPGTISVFVHYGGDRTNDPRVVRENDVVLTTYGVLASAYKCDSEKGSFFHQIKWYRVVLDEAHTIKSSKTRVAQSAFALVSHCRWCLTGTPLQNNLEDLYSLLCFLHVEPWCNWAWWHTLIQRPYESGDQRGLRLVKAILRPLMLRRTKDTKDKEGRPILVLPPANVQIVECEQSEAERDFYEALFKRSKVKFDQFVAQGKVLHNYASILELLLRLRQCCNHPFLVMSRGDTQQYADLNKLAQRFLEGSQQNSTNPGSVPTRAYVEEVVDNIRRGEALECPICFESSSDDPVLTPCAHRMCRECLLSSWRTPTGGPCPICRSPLNKADLITCPSESRFQVDVEKNWKESSKVTKLISCLQSIRKTDSGEKSIIFSQWTSFLDLLEIPLREEGIGFLRFDGKLSQKRREKVLNEFRESIDKPVLLMSLKAGGVGLNLTAASNVFLMDPWWNPAVEEQAIMRIHRIGQKRQVRVCRFIVKETIEERMQQVQARKQRMIAGALTDEEVRSARIEELKMLFR